MAEVARLYYHENYNQATIAELFDMSSSTVSRLIKEAHELKIVEVIIRYPFLTAPSLGKRVADRLRLREVHVLAKNGGTYVETVEKVAQLAARVLVNHLEDGALLGISLGMAVAQTARAFRVTTSMRCLVVRLQGANDNELMEGTDLAQVFSTQLGGEFLIIPAPWIMNSQAACEIITQEPSVKDAMNVAEHAQVGLVGMGSMDPRFSTLLRNKLITPQELEELKEAGAIGEICGKHYDCHGNVLDVPFHRRTVAINIEKLRGFETVIGVAAGQGKAEAILGAARGRLIDVLVTDAEAAEALLTMTD